MSGSRVARCSTCGSRNAVTYTYPRRGTWCSDHRPTSPMLPGWTLATCRCGRPGARRVTPRGAVTAAFCEQHAPAWVMGPDQLERVARTVSEPYRRKRRAA